MIDTLYVVPCGERKSTFATLARYLYRSDHFRYVLRAAETAAGRGTANNRVRIMSAKWGLVSPDITLDPYDVTIGDAEAVSQDVLEAQLRRIDPRRVVGMLPHAYRDALTPALGELGVSYQDLYAGCRGIGEQRARVRHLLHTTS